MNHFPRVAAALAALMFLAGCGQSGPLFVPGDPSTVQPQPQQQQQQQTNEEEDEDDDNDQNGATSP